MEGHNLIFNKFRKFDENRKRLMCVVSPKKSIKEIIFGDSIEYELAIRSLKFNLEMFTFSIFNDYSNINIWKYTEVK